MTNMRVQWVPLRAFCLVGVLLLAAVILVAQQPPPAPPAQAPAPAPARLLSPAELDTLVAPVALYPDGLLGQVLAASTYPLEVVEAGQWSQAHSDLQGSQLVEAARQQNWDPSVQALVVFPDVLSRLCADIRWTTALGNAFLAQQADVMAAVQRMRSRAMASGKLNSGPQQTVTTEEQPGQPPAVEIQPANPEVVYVPYYDPEYVWGPPDYGYYPAWDYAGFGFGFFPGIYLGGFWGGLGWGGWGWGLNWFNCGLYMNPLFFNHYGYGFHGGFGGRGFGGRGFGGGFGRGGHVLWSHDASHRLGVAYPNGALTSRYGAASNRGAMASGRVGGQAYASTHNAASGINQAQAGGWNRFGQTNRGSSYAPQSGYRSSPSYSNAYRSNPSYSYNSGAGRSMPSYRSTPSYGNAYRSSPSYGRSYGGRSMPSYRSSPSNGGGYRSSGGSHSSGGGGFHSSGGGGGFHGGGGGGSHGGGGHR